MKTLSFAAALLFPSLASTHGNYLRKTREDRLGRPPGFTWIIDDPSVDNPVPTTTSSTDSQLASSASGTATVVATLPAATTTSSTDNIATYLEYTPTCTTNSDCYPKLRVQVPSSNSLVVVSICGCYATSISNPFDECQGDSAECVVAGCFPNSCDGISAFCDGGICVLQDESSVSGLADIMSSSMSMSMSLDENQFEFLEEQGLLLSCSGHDDCVEMNGCCLSDGLCHSKTDVMPICWTVV